VLHVESYYHKLFFASKTTKKQKEGPSVKKQKEGPSVTSLFCHSSDFELLNRSELRIIIVKLRVDVVNVVVKEEREGGNVLEPGEIRGRPDDAGEHEELIEFVIADRERVALRFSGSIFLRFPLLHQRSRMLQALLGLLDLSQKLQERVAVGVLRRQTLAQRELEAVQCQVLLLVYFIELQTGLVGGNTVEAVEGVVPKAPEGGYGAACSGATRCPERHGFVSEQEMYLMRESGVVVRGGGGTVQARGAAGLLRERQERTCQ
jgi:hypothetical protein